MLLALPLLRARSLCLLRAPATAPRGFPLALGCCRGAGLRGCAEPLGLAAGSEPGPGPGGLLALACVGAPSCRLAAGPGSPRWLPRLCAPAAAAAAGGGGLESGGLVGRLPGSSGCALAGPELADRAWLPWEGVRGAGAGTGS